MITTRKQALIEKASQYFTGNPCKHGHVAFRRAKTGECIQCRTIAVKKWRLANPESVKKHNATQYKKYPEQKEIWGLRNKKYSRTHKAKVNAKTVAYQLEKARRVPSWINSEELWLIKEVYDLAVQRTKMTGLNWHVDHIIPLRGRLVSGLHTMANLQVILAVDNIKKSNRYLV
jgi:hypothetical protein